MYVIKDVKGLHRFFEATSKPASEFELKKSLENYLFTRGLFLDETKILAMHELSEKDYNEYMEAELGMRRDYSFLKLSTGSATAAFTA